VSEERKKLEELFKLSWLDEWKLKLAWGVLTRKVVPVMEKILGGNWRTTLGGILVAVMIYIQTSGAEFPKNWNDVRSLILGALLIWWGRVQKDGATGSQPGDPPTASRIAAARKAGDFVSEHDVKVAADAVKLLELARPKSG